MAKRTIGRPGYAPFTVDVDDGTARISYDYADSLGHSLIVDFGPDDAVEGTYRFDDGCSLVVDEFGAIATVLTKEHALLLEPVGTSVGTEPA